MKRFRFLNTGSRRFPAGLSKMLGSVKTMLVFCSTARLCVTTKNATDLQQLSPSPGILTHHQRKGRNSHRLQNQQMGVHSEGSLSRSHLPAMKINLLIPTSIFIFH